MNDIVHYESVINWSNGEPVVEYKQMLTKGVVGELPIAALSMPYTLEELDKVRSETERFLGIDEHLVGKSIGEVMNIRLARKAANGDKEAYRILQDRILGKPKQEVQSTSVSMTYSEYLDNLPEDEEEIMEANVND
jgi:hypothetical protein